MNLVYTIQTYTGKEFIEQELSRKLGDFPKEVLSRIRILETEQMKLALKEWGYATPEEVQRWARHPETFKDEIIQRANSGTRNSAAASNAANRRGQT